MAQHRLAQHEPGPVDQAGLNRRERKMILNRFIPARGKCFQYAAWAVMLLTLVHLCWLQLRPESDLRRLCAFAMRSPASRTALMPYQQLDQIAEQTRNGNLLLKLAGYAKTNPVVENSLSFVCFRTSYDLYPRRIFTAPADKVINNGQDIMRAEFDPGPQWLKEHDVRSVLIYGNDNTSGRTLRLEILPPRDVPAGMSTEKPGGNK